MLALLDSGTERVRELCTKWICVKSVYSSRVSYDYDTLQQYVLLDFKKYMYMVSAVHFLLVQKHNPAGVMCMHVKTDKAVV